MKNYALNEKQEKTYILNYYVKDGKIIINLANGEKEELDYSLENKKIILERMKKQVIDSLSLLSECKKSLKRLYLIESVLVAFLITNLLSIINDKAENEAASYIAEGIVAPFAISNAISIVNYNKILNDILKNKMFIYNEELFSKDNLNNHYIHGINKRIKLFLVDKDEITLNDMDNISYRDFKKLLAALKYNHDFDEKIKVKKLEK